MRTINKVILIGNIARDPMIKTTEGNKKVALYTIATNRYYKTADGESKSESEFHNCVSWGALAERCESFLVKWKLVYAEGRLKTRVIEKDDGEKIYKTEVVVSNIIFLNKRWEFADNKIEWKDEEEEFVGGSDFDDDKF